MKRFKYLSSTRIYLLILDNRVQYLTALYNKENNKDLSQYKRNVQDELSNQAHDFYLFPILLLVLKMEIKFPELTLQ